MGLESTEWSGQMVQPMMPGMAPPPPGPYMPGPYMPMPYPMPPPNGTYLYKFLSFVVEHIYQRFMQHTARHRWVKCLVCVPSRQASVPSDLLSSCPIHASASAAWYSVISWSTKWCRPSVHAPNAHPLPRTPLLPSPKSSTYASTLSFGTHRTAHGN